mmetsp:Transcript_15270/g.25139  ORF Transcript_15270/g.25139 Transcript_15270/m.25139 type:complete len:255 (-) Transcript_15270:45-809(-)
MKEVQVTKVPAWDHPPTRADKNERVHGLFLFELKLAEREIEELRHRLRKVERENERLHREKQELLQRLPAPATCAEVVPQRLPLCNVAGQRSPDVLAAPRSATGIPSSMRRGGKMRRSFSSPALAPAAHRSSVSAVRWSGSRVVFTPAKRTLASAAEEEEASASDVLHLQPGEYVDYIRGRQGDAPAGQCCAWLEVYTSDFRVLRAPANAPRCSFLVPDFCWKAQKGHEIVDVLIGIDGKVADVRQNLLAKQTS